MFDIKIGTLIPAESALTMIPQLNAVGFESYELNFNDCCALANGSEGVLKEYGKRVLDVLDGRKISALGIYANTIEDENTRRAVENLIANAEHFDCDRVGTFAGGHPALSVRETIPDFVKVFTPLIELAESKGVRIGLENCGDGWDRGSSNIAFCPEAWELIFNEISSDALGLEWEPCHAVMQLMDPIQQVRRWAARSFMFTARMLPSRTTSSASTVCAASMRTLGIVRPASAIQTGLTSVPYLFSAASRAA